MTTKRLHTWTATGQTVGVATANFTDPNAEATPSGSTIRAEGVIVGRDAATGNSVAIKVEGSFKNVAGTLTLEGSLSTPLVLGNAALATAVGSLNASAGVVRGAVLGIAALTIDWLCHMKWVAYTP